MTTLASKRPYRATAVRSAHRRTAVIVGVLFIVGTAAGVLSVVVAEPVLGSANILREAAANETALILSAILVLVMGFPLAMVPIMMYPIFKKQNEVLAQGAILFRGVLEAVNYLALALVTLLLVTVGREFAAAGSPAASHFQTWSALLLGAMDWIEVTLALVFSLGALMLGYLFYRTAIIPRWLALWGLLGAALYFVAPLLVIFDSPNLELSLTTGVGILLAPLALQEMVFAVWVIVKGFDETAVASLAAQA